MGSRFVGSPGETDGPVNFALVDACGKFEALSKSGRFRSVKSVDSAVKSIDKPSGLSRGIEMISIYVYSSCEGGCDFL